MIAPPLGQGITDFHVHAFPDDLAARAMHRLQTEGSIRAFLDGRLSSLLASMDQNGIERSVLCSIATRPGQFEPILAWSQAIRSRRIIPLASVHPADPEALARIDRIADAGLVGLKMHPFYQEFWLDEPRLLPLFQRISERRLLLVMHTGFDIAFPEERRADPSRIRQLLDTVPELRLVATHLGAWRQWPEVAELLVGRRILMEISFALDLLPAAEARHLLLAHPAECLLFGTDSPWTDQGATLALFRGLGLPPALEEQILAGNAARLLDGQDGPPGGPAAVER
ncbi:MAG: amidohydrolase family protein [Thermodesulfobacteriota bacterium]